MILFRVILIFTFIIAGLISPSQSIKWSVSSWFHKGEKETEVRELKTIMKTFINSLHLFASLLPTQDDAKKFDELKGRAKGAKGTLLFKHSKNVADSTRFMEEYEKFVNLGNKTIGNYIGIIENHSNPVNISGGQKKSFDDSCDKLIQDLKIKGARTAENNDKVRELQESLKEKIKAFKEAVTNRVNGISSGDELKEKKKQTESALSVSQDISNADNLSELVVNKKQSSESASDNSSGEEKRRQRSTTKPASPAHKRTPSGGIDHAKLAELETLRLSRKQSGDMEPPKEGNPVVYPETNPPIAEPSIPYEAKEPEKVFVKQASNLDSPKAKKKESEPNFTAKEPEKVFVKQASSLDSPKAKKKESELNFTEPEKIIVKQASSLDSPKSKKKESEPNFAAPIPLERKNSKRNSSSSSESALDNSDMQKDEQKKDDGLVEPEETKIKNKNHETEPKLDQNVVSEQQLKKQESLPLYVEPKMKEADSKDHSDGKHERDIKVNSFSPELVNNVDTLKTDRSEGKISADSAPKQKPPKTNDSNSSHSSASIESAGSQEVQEAKSVPPIPQTLDKSDAKNPPPPVIILPPSKTLEQVDKSNSSSPEHRDVSANKNHPESIPVVILPTPQNFEKNDVKNPSSPEFDVESKKHKENIILPIVVKPESNSEDRSAKQHIQREIPIADEKIETKELINTADEKKKEDTNSNQNNSLSLSSLSLSSPSSSSSSSSLESSQNKSAREKSEEGEKKDEKIDVGSSEGGKKRKKSAPISDFGSENSDSENASKKENINKGIPENENLNKPILDVPIKQNSRDQSESDHHESLVGLFKDNSSGDKTHEHYHETLQFPDGSVTVLPPENPVSRDSRGKKISEEEGQFASADGSKGKEEKKEEKKEESHIIIPLMMAAEVKDESKSSKSASSGEDKSQKDKKAKEKELENREIPPQIGSEKPLKNEEDLKDNSDSKRSSPKASTAADKSFNALEGNSLHDTTLSKGPVKVLPPNGKNQKAADEVQADKKKKKKEQPRPKESSDASISVSSSSAGSSESNNGSSDSHEERPNSNSSNASDQKAKKNKKSKPKSTETSVNGTRDIHVVSEELSEKYKKEKSKNSNENDKTPPDELQKPQGYVAWFGSLGYRAVASTYNALPPVSSLTSAPSRAYSWWYGTNTQPETAPEAPKVEQKQDSHPHK